MRNVSLATLVLGGGVAYFLYKAYMAQQAMQQSRQQIQSAGGVASGPFAYPSFSGFAGCVSGCF